MSTPSAVEQSGRNYRLRIHRRRGAGPHPVSRREEKYELMPSNRRWAGHRFFFIKRICLVVRALFRHVPMIWGFHQY